MNRSEILRILGLLAIVVVLALAGVGLERTVAALSRGSGSGATAQQDEACAQAGGAAL